MHFFKYHGTGNDFVLIDNRTGKIKLQRKQIADICHRRFGVGADGLMLLQMKKGFDFEMIYYNADGGETSMCGNGGRCIVQFASDLRLIQNEAHFLAIDGAHKARIENGKVALEMLSVKKYDQNKERCILDTGSPHYVAYLEDLKNVNVEILGREIRNSKAYKAEGINVNFVEKLSKNELFVRTYERGVENETYSCGTGVVAATLADFLNHKDSDKHRLLHTLGGKLEVHFDYENDGFKDILLSGPAKFVFEGEWPD